MLFAQKAFTGLVKKCQTLALLRFTFVHATSSSGMFSSSLEPATSMDKAVTARSTCCCRNVPAGELFEGAVQAGVLEHGPTFET